jgi:acetyltransferase-like isoleucine patch superfamily enzyme
MELPERRFLLRTKLLRPYYAWRFAEFGEGVRIAPLRVLKGAHKMAIGSKAFIYPDCSISVEQSAWEMDGPRIVLGELCVLQSNVTVTCAESVVLEDYAAIGANTLIADNDHTIDGSHDSILLTPIRTGPVRIGRGVWVGNNCAILRGVTIGAHSVIGAGSVVNKDIPPYSIAVGAPARVIGQVPHPDRAEQDALT